MKIKKGDKVTVKCARKGTYRAIAKEDFDTVTDEWYPVTLDQGDLDGMTTVWIRGEDVPCRRGHAKISKRRK